MTGPDPPHTPAEDPLDSLGCLPDPLNDLIAEALNELWAGYATELLAQIDT